MPCRLLTVATILRVPHSALREVAHSYPAIAEAFWRECVVDAAILSECVVNVGRRDARSRAAHLLCEVACRTRSVQGDSFAFGFAATQGHMSDMLGLTPVHVNRVLRALREDGIVTMHAHMVRVHHWSRLMEIGEFDADYLHMMPLPGLSEVPLEPAPPPQRLVAAG